MSADPTTGAVAGRSSIRFVPDLPTATIVLRLWANAPRPTSVGSSISLGAVTERGVARAVTRPDVTTAVIDLGRWVESGTVLDLEVPWTLQVEGPVADRISRQSGSLRMGSFLPLLAWEPGAGWAREPPTAGFAEATTSMTADWDLRIDVPDGFDVVATGTSVGPGRWRAVQARDVAVVVGRLSSVSGTALAPEPVSVTVSVHDGIDDPNRYLARVIDALEKFARWYGPYPWPTYQLSITPDLPGGIEYPMHVMQGPGTSGRTTPHEVAHMWFYGLVGDNQARDPWLDEGLATWAEGRFEGTLDEFAAARIPADGAGRAGSPMTYWEAHRSSYYRSVYVQPAAALARLGRPELVDCALAWFVADRAHTIARPSDLYRALDLTFRSWRSALAAAGLG